MKCFIRLLALVFICNSLFSQNSIAKRNPINWKNSPFEQPIFIENLGQFSYNNYDVRFGAKNNGVEVFFLSNGIVWKHTTIKKSEKEIEREKNERLNHKSDKNVKKEKREAKDEYDVTSQSLEMEWVGANKNVIIEKENKVDFYYTYKINGKGILAHAYSKITYKKLYDGIDIEILMPKDKKGVKYNIIAKVGADISKIKMKYKNASKIEIDNKGNLIINSDLGQFTDLAPISYLKKSKTKVESSFSIKNNIVSIDAINTSTCEDLIIDPWITSPTFAGSTNVYDVNYDNAGNVYAHGSAIAYELVKIDDTGAIQWVHSLAGGSYAYGDFAVDEGTGISYIGEGKPGILGTVVHKISPSGFDVAQSIFDPEMGEIWRMEFNKAGNNFVLAGGGGNNHLGILDTFMVESSVPLFDNDLVLLALDRCGTNNCYVAGTNHNTYASDISTIGTFIHTTPNGYTYPYGYIDGLGYNGMAVSPQFLYTYDGTELKRWDKNTGAYINNFMVPGASGFYEGGLDVDECENIYIGGNKSVQVFDQTYSLIATYPLPDDVFDLKLDRNSDKLYACGVDFVTSIDLPPMFTIVTTQTPTCFGSCDGQASISVTGDCASPTYSWMPGAMTNSLVTGLCAGTYTVEVFLGCSRVITETITVVSTPNPTLSISPSTVICLGTSKTLTVSGALSYTWSPGGSLSSTSLATVVASPTITTTYTIIGANGICTHSTITTVSVTPSPILAISPSTLICLGESKTLTVSGASSYTWSPGGSLSSTSLATVVATPTITTTYTVIGANGTCTNSALTTLSVTPNPTITISPSVTICLGASSTLNVSGASSYTWSPGGSLSSTSLSTVVASPTITTTYTVVGANGTCTNSAVTSVIVNSLSTLTISPSSSLCLGTAASLSVSGSPSYTWSPSTSLSSSIGSTVVANPTVTTTYTVIAGVGSCTNSAVTTVSVLPNPTLSISASTIMCSGNATTLSIGGASSYTWSPGGSLSSTSLATVVANPTITTTYTVIGTTGTCTNSAITTVSVISPTSLTISPSSSLCLGASMSLSVSGSSSYSWSPSSSLSVSIGSIVVESPTVTTTYTVIAGIGSCTNSVITTVSVNPVPILNVTASPSIICTSNSSTLTALGGTTYSWSPSVGLSASSGSITVANPSLSTTYTVTGANSSGCVSSSTVFIDVVPNPTVNITSLGSLTICAGTSATLQASGATNYLWSPSGSLTSSSGTVVIATPTVTTLYTLIGNNGTCTDSKSVQVIVIPVIIPKISPGDTAICLGKSIKLTASGGNTYQWSPASTLSSSVAAKVIAKPLTTTAYSVIVSNNNICPQSTSVLITVNPLPYVYAGRDSTINIDESITLIGAGDGVFGYIPLNGEALLCNYCSSVTVAPKENTCYLLHSINNFSCENTDEVCITVTKDYGIYIPNAFSPNGDVDNELFYPQGYGIASYEMYIYDRWGKLIFKSSIEHPAWDGKLKGKVVEQGVYVYKINIKTMGNKEVEKVGHVSVIGKTK